MSKRTRERHHARRVMFCLLAVAAFLAIGVDAASAWPTGEHPPTVSADALPTVQIDGVVWTQEIVGDVVYVGGNFSNARPAGAMGGNVPRSNMLAYNIVTGQLINSFAPNPNAQVRTIESSPDGSVIYIGGDFTSIGGVSRSRIAAISVATGQVLPFAPPVGWHVHDLAVTENTVFAGGNFLSVGSQYRGRLAAFARSNGALLSWAPDAADRVVHGVEVSPDRTKVAVAGAFEALNGSTSVRGFAVVDATTGQLVPHAATSRIRNGGANSAITSLYTDGDLLYGTGYHFGAGGTLEGSFASSWDDGTLVWVNNCHGDVHNIHAQGGVVYSVGHAHHCGDIDGFGQRDGSDGAWDEYRAMATTKQAVGTVGTNRYGGSYSDFGGLPRPDLLNFFPTLNRGTYTGTNQGPWHVAGDDRYIVMGGEFTRVNFQNQQGLVRFARRDLAPNAQGPYLFNATYPVRVRSLWPASATITWPGNIDRDDATLSYRVFRRPVGSSANGQLVHQRQVTAPFWALPNMTFTDSSPGAGPGNQYRVQAWDASGNVANSPWTAVTAEGGGTDYLAAVLDSNPDSLWRLGESPGSNIAVDLVGPRNLVVPSSGVTFGQAGAIGGDPNTAAQFAGTSNNHFLRTTSREHPPDIFSLEAWVRAPSNASGGLIVGFNRSDSGDGDTARHDRALYMDTSGRVLFALNPTTPVTLSSGTDLRDGQWHHVVGALGPDGMSLYVDGRRVATRSDIIRGRSGYQGFIRIGAGALNGFPGTNTTNGRRYVGTIDDVALYRSALTAQQVRAHYEASGRAVAGLNTPPVAAFSATVDELTASFDATASSDQDGTIVAYDWNFGDGSSGTGAKVQHSYAGAGSYAVALTVTDDEGAKHTVTETVVAWNPSGVLHRVNAGGPLVASPDGDRPWAADTLATPSAFRVAGGENIAGPWNVTAVEPAVVASTPTEIFQTERWDPVAAPEMRWRFPVDAGTPVEVRLYLMNGYAGTSSSGSRIFGVNLDGQVALTGLDLSAEAGHAVGTVRTLTTVSDGQIDLEFIHQVENPLINGIEIVSLQEDPDPQPGVLVAAPQHVDLGDVAVGDTAAAVVTLTNTGGTSLTVTRAEVSGDAGFAVTSALPVVLDPGASSDLSVSFSPQGAGVAAGSIALSHDGVDAPTTFTLAGTGTGPPDPGPVVLAQDRFERSVSSGLGSADVGGPWTLQGAATSFSVADGQGRISGAVGGNRGGYLTQITASQVDVSAEVVLDRQATGGGAYASVFGRRISAGNDFRLLLRYQSNGVVVAYLAREIGGTQTILTWGVVPGVGVGPDHPLRVRLEVTGDDVSTLRAKVWPAAQSEPSGWLLATTETTPQALRATGHVGVLLYTSGSWSGTAPLLSIDSYEVRSIAAPAP